MADHIALYRKYRPSDFDNLVGQEAISLTLRNAAKLDRISQVYLFSGPKGTGKTSMARLIAKVLNCEALKNGNPCDTCQNCTNIADGRMIDVIEIDGASNRGIDEVRALRENALFTPSQGKKKVYIIDEVHMLTKEAFNALLKILEEPVSHIHFILATTELHKIPATILSRAQQFNFRRITADIIEKRITFVCEQERIKSEPDALKLIAESSDGSMRDALVLVEQLMSGNTLTVDTVRDSLGLVQSEQVTAFLKLVEKGQTTEALKLISDTYKSGTDLVQFTTQLIGRLRTQMFDAASAGDTTAAKRCNSLIDLFVDALLALKTTPIPQLPLELAVIELAETKTTLASPQATTQPSRDSEIQRNTSQSTEHKAQSSHQATEHKAQSSSEETTPKPYVLTPNSYHRSPEAPQDHANTVSSQSSSTVTLTTIRQHWKDIIEKIVTPKVRMALRTARLKEITNGKLTLLMPSLFELGKINTAQAKNEISDAIKATISEEVEIMCEHDPSAQPVSIEVKTVRIEESDMSIQKAAEILGGTIIE